MVLPPDILRFRLLFGACLDGSAAVLKCRRSYRYICSGHVSLSVFICCSPTWRCHHPLPFLEEAGFEAVSGAEAVCLVSGHQLLHGLQNHTQLEVVTKTQQVRDYSTFQIIGGASINWAPGSWPVAEHMHFHICCFVYKKITRKPSITSNSLHICRHLGSHHHFATLSCLASHNLSNVLMVCIAFVE